MDTPDLHDQPALLTSQDSLAHCLQAMSGGNHWNKPTDRPSLDDWLAQGDDVDPAHHRRARELGVPLARLAGLEPEAAASGLIRPDVARRASVIHLRPGVAGTDVLYRMDDELVPARRLMRSLHTAVTSRVEVLGAVNFAGPRMPQDARTSFRLPEGREVALRSSVLPTVHSESVVLRLLATTESLWNLDQLGLGAADRHCFDDVMGRSH